MFAGVRQLCTLLLGTVPPWLPPEFGCCTQSQIITVKLSAKTVTAFLGESGHQELTPPQPQPLDAVPCFVSQTSMSALPEELSTQNDHRLPFLPSPPPQMLPLILNLLLVVVSKFPRCLENLLSIFSPQPGPPPRLNSIPLLFPSQISPNLYPSHIIIHCQVKSIFSFFFSFSLSLQYHCLITHQKLLPKPELPSQGPSIISSSPNTCFISQQ